MDNYAGPPSPRVGRTVFTRSTTVSLPAVLFVIRGLIADTLAQARAAGLTIGMAAITFVCVLFCLSVGVSGEVTQLSTRPWETPDFIPKSEAERLKMNPDAVRGEGVDVPSGDLTLFFGMVHVPLQRQSGNTVRLVQIILAGGLADTIGILLALVWTSSFLPGFLEPASASVMLAKPAPRWALLLGKFAGVVIAVVFQAFLFVLFTWLALGMRTGLWDVRYFVAVPVMFVHFVVFLSVSTCIAVFSRSSVACALGTLVAWFGCFAINLIRHDEKLSSGSNSLIEAAYWIAPKPLDYNLILTDALRASDYFGAVVDTARLKDQGAFHPELSIATGLLFAAGMLGWAARRLSRTDY